jgi:hypothetical protein
MVNEFRAQRAQKAAELEDTNDVLANLGALTRDELEILRELLTKAPPRFEVHIISGAYAMIGKGVLIVVRELSGLSWICKIHPAIVQHRDLIVDQIVSLRLHD